MRRHAEYGYQFLSNLEWRTDAAEIVYCRHEKFDGSGYPRGLKGKDIPFGARVFAVVDTVDAMIYKRPYNRPVTFGRQARKSVGVPVVSSIPTWSSRLWTTWAHRFRKSCQDEALVALRIIRFRRIAAIGASGATRTGDSEPGRTNGKRVTCM
jgi:hypothetical protein